MHILQENGSTILQNICHPLEAKILLRVYSLIVLTSMIRTHADI